MGQKCGHCQVARKGHEEGRSVGCSRTGCSGLGGAECAQSAESSLRGLSRERGWGERPGALPGGSSEKGIHIWF